MTVLAVVSDLLFRSKIQAAADAAGQTVQWASQPEDAPSQAAGVSLVVVDLGLAPAATLAAIAALRQQLPHTPIIGFGSHVETALLAQAQAAGCTQALPRSAFTQQLPVILRNA